MSHPRDQLCFKCEEAGVLRLLQKLPLPGESKDIGSIEDIRQRQNCPFCRLALTLLEQDDGDISEQANPHYPLQFRVRPEPHLDRFDVTYKHLIGYVGRRNDRDAAVWKESRGPEMNYSLYREWIRDCTEFHSTDCEKRKSPSPPLDILVIDIQEMKLVRATSSVRYVCLSYVWGGCTTLQTKHSLLDQFLRKGGLQSSLGQLPRTVSDAITFVARLGERYLWIDSICIVQDDPSKFDQIKRMDIIYGHAYLTIAALAGTDANAGLPGVRDASRMPIRSLAAVSGGYLLETTPKRPGYALVEARYSTRAWTFQEQILSRRVLYFTQQQVFFQCGEELRREVDGRIRGKDLRREESCFQNPITHYLHDVDGDDTTPLMDAWGTYKVMVRDYVQREMTNKSDILNAFEGCMSIMGQYFQCEFIWGLPNILFDTMLLWFPVRGGVTRRVSSDRQYPSWSWAGWVGHLEFAKVGPSSDIALDTRSTFKQTGAFYVNWNGKCQKVMPQYYTDGILESELHKALGRMRSNILNSDDDGENQRRLRETKDDQFHPNLVVQDDPAVPLLQFRAATLAADFYSFEQVEKTFLTEAHTRLRDNQNRHCGTVFEGSLPSSGSSQWEFVLVSRSSSIIDKRESDYIQPYDESHFRSYRETYALNLVIVLLIEWNGDYAQRLGLGAIFVDAWPSHLTKMGDVRLI